jgi:hypothetical protein
LRQIITVIDVFEGDTDGMSPLHNLLNYKNIINDPYDCKFGTINLIKESYDSTTYSLPNKLVLNDINFINIFGSKIFTIIIDSKVVIHTQNFNFLNLEDAINLVLVPKTIGVTAVKYNCGFLKSTINPPIYCLSDDIEYDSI